MAYVPLADQEQELHHPHSWVTKYVFSQDHKVIAVQYGSVAVAVGVVALVLSLLMRMQLGFPETRARTAVDAAVAHVGIEAPLTDLIRAALAETRRRAA